MRLPRFDATTAPTGTGLVRADPRAQTDVGDAQFRGLQAFGGAIQGVGGVAAKAAKARQALDDQAAKGEADRRAIDALDEALDTYKNFDPLVGNTVPINPEDYYDPDKFLNFDNPKKAEFLDLTYKPFEEKIKGMSKVFKDPKARQAWENSQLTGGYQDLTDAGNRKQQEAHEALIIGNATNAAENGDIETSNEWIDIAEKHGLIGPKRAAAERDKNEKVAVTAEAISLYQGGDFGGARELVGDSTLSIRDKESLIITIGVAERRAEKEQGKDDREKQSELYAREDEGEILKREDFEAAWSDPVEADQHFDEFQKGLAAEAKGEVNFVKKGDPVVLAKTEAIIDLNPTTITEADLYAMATSGLGTENITGLVDRLRKSRKGVVNEFHQRLSALFNSNYFGDADDDEGSLKFKRAKDVLETFLTTQKPSKVEAELFFNGLITKNFSGIRRGGWEEKGFRHKYIDISGNEITQRFRFGDIRTRKVKDKIVQEFYAGANDDGEPLWLPRR